MIQIVKSFLFLLLLLFLFHQGISQELDTISKRSSNILFHSFSVPTVGIGLGFYSRINNVPFGKHKVRSFRMQHFDNFHSNLDDYFQYAPIVITYGLHFLPFKGKNNFLNKSILWVKSEILMIALVYPFKAIVGDARPGTTVKNAFPSGHTTQAFVAAHFLYKEYGKEYPVIGIFGYAFAVSTAVWRVLNDRHWSADVLAGAGLGILTVNLVYLMHRHRYKRK